MRSHNIQDQPEDFFYLMDLPLPVPDNHEHYAEMLSAVDPSIKSAIRDYEMAYLPWCKERGYASSKEYRREKAMTSFLEWANNSSTFDSLVLMERSKHVFQPMDRCLEVRGELLLRIKMVDPDFSVMKLVSIQRDVPIPDNWKKLCSKLDIPRFLMDSNVFMEDCFDQYEREKCLEMQKHIIGKLVERFEKDYEMVLVSPTEVMIKYPEKGVGGVIAHLNEVYGLASCIKYELTPLRDGPVYDRFIKKEMNTELEKELKELKDKKWTMARTQRYEDAANFRDMERKLLVRLESEYREQFDKKWVKAGMHSSYSLRQEYILQKGEMIETKKELIGVPDNRYYAYFRTMIMNELLEEKDLMFMHEGRLAKWTTENQD